jgi:alpha-glucosidase
MRNHAEYHTIPQEFYRWPLVADAARGALATRYRLLDYLYTAMYRQNQTGSPTISPLFFMYPEDANTFDIQMQFFFGDSILVSPVLEPNKTSVSAYMPNDLFYDFSTHQAVQGTSAMMTFDDVSFTQITSHIRGGSIIPMRIRSANTTTEIRKQSFELVIAPSANGTANGSLYLDDGDSLVQAATSDIQFSYSADGVFSMTGSFDYDPGVVIEAITVLGVESDVRRSASAAIYDAAAKTLTHMVDLSLKKAVTLSLGDS